MDKATDVLDRWSTQNPRAVLLDFNGTLSDDENLLAEVFAQIVHERWGVVLSTEDYRKRLLGLSDHEIVERLAAEHGDDSQAVRNQMLESRRDLYLERTRAASPVSNDARDLVRQLLAQGARVGIVTGAQRFEVEDVLEGCGLRDAFDVVICTEDVSAGKPDPEGYTTAAAMLGIDAGSCLVFEDSPVGVRAAKSAGMTVIGVGDPVLLHEADAVLERVGLSLLD